MGGRRDFTTLPLTTGPIKQELTYRRKYIHYVQALRKLGKRRDDLKHSESAWTNPITSKPSGSHHSASRVWHPCAKSAQRGNTSLLEGPQTCRYFYQCRSQILSSKSPNTPRPTEPDFQDKVPRICSIIKLPGRGEGFGCLCSVTEFPPASERARGEKCSASHCPSTILNAHRAPVTRRHRDPNGLNTTRNENTCTNS